jgi:hypothetical protein
MTDKELEAIEARAKVLPDGWYVEDARPGREDEARVYDGRSFGVCKPTTDNPAARRQTAEFIAHARTDVPNLIAEVRRLKMLNQATAERLWDDGFYATVPGWTPGHEPITEPTNTHHDLRLAVRKAAIDQILNDRGE